MFVAIYNIQSYIRLFYGILLFIINSFTSIKEFQS